MLKPLQGKVLDEVFDKFKQAQENSEALTFNAFIEILLESYLNPKTKTVQVARPTDDQLQEIQLKNNKIGELQTAYDLQKQQMEALAEECRLLSKQLSEQEPAAPGLQLADNQFVLTVQPIIAKVLEAEAETAKRKSGKEFSFSDILLNNFWESIKNGVSYPFKIWSSAELAKIANDLKAAE